MRAHSTGLSADLYFAWELGAGLGHASRFRPQVVQAMDAGLTVKCVAIRKEDATKQLPCPVEEAPWLRAPKRATVPHIGHMGDTLAALGWADPAHLQASVDRWREMFERDRPKALVMDSAPVALLASQGLPIKKVWLADGWNTPPSVSPLPDMAERAMGRKRSVPDTEPKVVESINSVLSEFGQAPIDRLGALFQRVDLFAMLTFEELDPYGPRKGVSYHGVWGMQPGTLPDWPSSVLGKDAPGVFVYLKPFPNRAVVLKLLASSGLPTLALVPKANDAERAAVRGGAVQLLEKPMDWSAVGKRAAMVICHASPGMMGLSLCMGVPVVGIPLSLEQTVLSRRAEQCGAVLRAKHDDPESIRAALHKALTDESVIEASLAFSEKYRDYDPDQAAAGLGREIVALCKKAQ